MSRILTGSKAQVRINGNIVGFASGMDIDAEYTLQDVNILGQLPVGDLAETGHTVRFSVNYFKLVDGSFAASAQDLGFEQAVVQNMRNQGVFDFEVLDTTNQNAIMFKVLGCKFAGGRGAMESRGVWSGTWNFRGIQVDHPTSEAGL